MRTTTEPVRSSMPEIIYLAAPYSHPDPAVREQRFHAANRAAGGMMRRGKLVFSPISHTHPIAVECELPRGWRFWRKYDEAIMAACSRVIVLRLDGWEDSVGVAAEIEMAKRLGLPVEFRDA